MNLKINLTLILLTGFIQALYALNTDKAYETSKTSASKVLPITLNSSFDYIKFTGNQKNRIETKEFYLEKSQRQKTAAWILLGGGTAMGIAGAIGSGTSGSESDIFSYMFETGLLIDLISIPFFISASNNKSRFETKEFYLNKRKNQKSAAWILLGTGTAAAIGGIIGFANEPLFGDNSSASRADTYGFVFLAGIIADLASIPFFISAFHNKRMASSLSLKREKIYIPQQTSVQHYPALTLKFSFK